jgi:uncharacterized protein (TIGR03000 family)
MGSGYYTPPMVYGEGTVTYPYAYGQPYMVYPQTQSGYFTPGVEARTRESAAGAGEGAERLGAPRKPATPPGVGGREEDRDRDRNKDRDRREKDDSEATGPAPVKLIVHLPADARLTIDGEATTSTSDTRVFVSPPLARGKTYHYRLEAQINRTGETMRTSQTVEVEPGKETPVYLDFPGRTLSRR